MFNNDSENFLRKQLGGRITALRADFVAKPETLANVREGLEERILTSWAREQGFLNGMVLVSDQEARLTTLITFWSASALEASREQKVKWLHKILKPYLDRCLHIHTDSTYLLMEAQERLSDTALSPVFASGLSEATIC